MSEKKISPTRKKKKEMLKKVDLRKLVQDVEEQKQILNEHQRILNQLSTKNKSISLYIEESPKV